jgi:hypothetical protein
MIEISNGGETMNTMYALAKLVNKELAARGSDKRVREQMLYTYRAKGLIKTQDGKVSDTVAAAFVAKYCDKHAPIVSK